MKNQSKFTTKWQALLILFLFFSISLFTIYLLSQTSVSAQEGNSFNCIYQNGSCVLNTDNTCFTGNFPNESLCTSVTDENKCQTTKGYCSILNPLPIPSTQLGCTKVASNQTSCSGTQAVACSQSLPTPGNIDRWCCDTQKSCDETKGVVQQEITNQLAGGACIETDDPEFHSLRPYPAKPCGGTVKARYCSNDLVFIEDFEMRHKGDCTEQLSSEGDLEFTCDPGFTVEPHNLYVELDNSFLPIMGNTEDQLDDAAKVNEYASWYLNGVIDKAENKDATDEQIVNFSGPVRKLLPFMIQDAQRIEIIKSATNKVTVFDDDLGEYTTSTENHDQIVVDSERLSSWEGDLSFFRIGALAWDKRMPPLPWDDGTVRDPAAPKVPFKSQILYKKAYNEWLGKSCVILPIIGLQCVDIKIGPFDIVSNKYAELWHFVPLSNTSDKKGSEYIAGGGDPQYIPSAGTQIGEVSSDKVKIPPLYFAHMQEVKDLSEILNESYIPKDFESVPLPKTTEYNNCSVAVVRTNKGDNLYPGDPNELLVPNITYPITQATCHEVYRIIEKPCDEVNSAGVVIGVGTCETIEHTLECPAQITVKIKTGTKTPWAKEIFATTVADSASTFRKIFPKVGVGAPVSCIADIPTITNVTYEPDIGGQSEIPNEGGLEFKVVRIPEDGAGDSPQLTFPHIGSVYEYFLKGIQTALRPKGYGEPIYDGVLCSDLDGGDCSFNMAKINNAIKNSASKYNVPEKLLRSIFEIESYEYIADPSSYVCEENFAGAAGVAQIVKSTYDTVVCANEKMENDIPMCGNNRPQLSRCNIDDAFELMARILIFKAGRFRSCNSTNGIAESEKTVWYNAACNYYGSHEPDDLTRGLQNDLPVSARRPDRDMNYCDIVCQKMGQCPDYPAR